jgi:zinc protease
LLAEIALEPSFPPAEVARLRAQRLAEIQRRADRPGVLAEEALLRAVYRGSPYGRFVAGDADTVGRIDRDDLARFHRAEWIEGRRPALLVVGDVAPELAAAEAARAFDSWPPSDGSVPTRSPTALTPNPAHAAKVLLVDRPAAPQTELRMGWAGPPRIHPDHAALRVLLTLLGGKFTSRLNLSLRERHGVTYGAAARWSERRGDGPIVLSAAVANPAVGLAAREMRSEVERLREEQVSDSELRETRDYLSGVFPYTLQTSGDVLQRLDDLATFGLEPGEIDRHLDEVTSLDAGTLRAAARRHLRPEAATIVAVGPADQLEEQFPGEGVERLPRPTAG